MNILSSKHMHMFFFTSMHFAIEFFFINTLPYLGTCLFFFFASSLATALQSFLSLLLVLVGWVRGDSGRVEKHVVVTVYPSTRDED